MIERKRDAMRSLKPPRFAGGGVRLFIPRDEGSNDRGVYGARWRRVRAEVVAEQPICARPGCGKPTADVNHVVPHKGPLDPLFLARSNLEGLCRGCHNVETWKIRKANAERLAALKRKIEAWRK